MTGVGVGIGHVVLTRPRGARFGRDMPIDTPDLLGSFHSFRLLLSCWAGVTPPGVATFAYCTPGGKAFLALPATLLCLMQFGTIVACLGSITLSANVTVMVAPEALFHPVGTVVELALMHLAFLHYPRVNNGIGGFRGRKFDDK